MLIIFFSTRRANKFFFYIFFCFLRKISPINNYDYMTLRFVFVRKVNTSSTIFIKNYIKFTKN